MSIILKNARTLNHNGLVDLKIEGNQVVEMGTDLTGDEIYNLDGKVVTPALIDVHIHTREPGFEQKETIETVTKAAARGGYSTIVAMPNLNPAPDSVENIKYQLDLINKSAHTRVYPFGTITKDQMGRGELVDFEAINEYVVGFSDDGVGVQEAGMMLEAMHEVSKLDSIVVAHCEDESLLYGGYVHKSKHNDELGRRGILSVSESVQIARDVLLSEVTGCKYHVCHISTKESIRAVREAKKNGINVTAEVTPHHLLLTDVDVVDDANYKMNPPLRASEDKEALIEALLDGTIDMIATDHAPHTEEEKAKGLASAPFGIVGLETALPLMYTHFVQKGVMSFEQLINLMTKKPAERFNLPLGKTEVGGLADLTIIDLEKLERIDKDNFLSCGKNTPFNKWVVAGIPVMTIIDGEIKYNTLKPE